MENGEWRTENGQTEGSANACQTRRQSQHMPGQLHHEELYRGAETLARLRDLRVVICGAGALGSHLADNLARQGFATLRVIDKDRIEEHNVGTQLYGASEIGLWKVDALRNRLFRAAGIEIEAIRKELALQNAASLLADSHVIVDCFDNSASRALVQETSRRLGTACLHVGLSADYCEVIWDEHYRVPRDVAGDACDYPLARNLVLLAAAIASEVLMAWCLEGRKPQWTATLKDFAVRAAE